MGSRLMRLLLVLLITSQVVTAAPAAEKIMDPNGPAAASDPNAAIKELLLAIAKKKHDGKILADLPFLNIVVEKPSQDAQEAGLTESVLKSTALAALRTKIPNLRVDDSCVAGLVVTLNLHQVKDASTVSSSMFVSSIALELLLGVTIEHNGRFTGASVWRRDSLATGNSQSARHTITRRLEDFVTEFAGKYYEDGNP